MALATFFLCYFFWDIDVMLGGVTAVLTERGKDGEVARDTGFQI